MNSKYFTVNERSQTQKACNFIYMIALEKQNFRDTKQISESKVKTRLWQCTRKHFGVMEMFNIFVVMLVI